MRRPRKAKKDMTVLELAQSMHVRREDQEEIAGDDMAARIGAKVIRFSQPRNSMQTPGIPDRRYYTKFGPVWWEAKAEDGEQSKAQWEFQMTAEDNGEDYVLGPARVLAEWIAWASRGRPPIKPWRQMGDEWRYVPPKPRKRVFDPTCAK